MQAVLFAGLPGPAGGQAVAEILFGVTNPSGKLPFSYPRWHAMVPYPYFKKPDQVLCPDLTDFADGMVSGDHFANCHETW